MKELTLNNSARGLERQYVGAQGENVEVLGVAGFYQFRQNNSGGHFHFDESAGLTHFVIVQAYSPADANQRARSLGIYFDGCAKGLDCSCCGDRWNEQYGGHGERGDVVPQVYGEPVDLEKQVLWQEYSYQSMPDGKEIAIHYLDGSIRWAGVAEKSRKPKKLSSSASKNLPSKLKKN